VAPPGIDWPIRVPGVDRGPALEAQQVCWDVNLRARRFSGWTADMQGSVLDAEEGSWESANPAKRQAGLSVPLKGAS
jgi:hypothetical protein